MEEKDNINVNKVELSEEEKKQQYLKYYDDMVNLIHYFLKKYIISTPILKIYYDDLFSLSIYKCYRGWLCHNFSYSISSYVYYTVKHVIYLFFKKNKNKRRDGCLDNSSLDAKFNSCDDFGFFNIIKINEDFDQNFNYNYIMSIYNEATKNQRKHIKEIMDLIIKGYNCAEIARKKNITRQAVFDIHNKLKLLMYIELKKNNFKSDYMKNFNVENDKIPLKYRKQLLNL